MTVIKPGMAGYCKLCQSQYLPQINQRIRDGWSAAKVNAWVMEASKGSLRFNRQTFYAHRDNIGGLHITDADAPAPEPKPEVDGEAKPVTNDQFLERLRDLSYHQNLDSPDARVDLKTGLAAVKILEERKHSKTPVLVLAKVFTGQLPETSTETIEGEFRELPAEPVQIGAAE